MRGNSGGKSKMRCYVKIYFRSISKEAADENRSTLRKLSKWEYAYNVCTRRTRIRVCVYDSFSMLPRSCYSDGDEWTGMSVLNICFLSRLASSPSYVDAHAARTRMCAK